MKKTIMVRLLVGGMALFAYNSWRAAAEPAREAAAGWPLARDGGDGYPPPTIVPARVDGGDGYPLPPPPTIVPAPTAR